MVAERTQDTPVFRVIDALDAPHGGRILRLQLQEGKPPRVRELKHSRLAARDPSGTLRKSVTVKGFAAFGGKVSDQRLAATGRIDVHIREGEGDAPAVSIRWLLTPS